MIKPKSLVSIIMPAYNASLFIEETIQSVLAQTYINWELLVINDGSVDQTSAIVRKIADVRIILIEQENLGVACARNNGLSNAQGEYITFLDSDDLWSKEKLQKQVELFELNSYKNLGLIYTDYRCFSKNSANQCSCSDLNIYDKNDLYKSLLVKDFIGTLTVMIRAEIIQNIGIFNPNFFGTEDWDYWIRIAKAYPIAFIPQQLAYYRVHSLGISKNISRHLSEEYKILCTHVLDNVEVPINIKRLALLIWQGKKLRYEIKMRNYLLSLKLVKNMIIENLRSPYNYIYFLKITLITLFKNRKCNFVYSED
jgi:glycosyltransferase involved in cell wall biosynthesis